MEMCIACFLFAMVPGRSTTSIATPLAPCYLLGVPHIATSDLVCDELVASTISTPSPSHYRPPLPVGFLKQASKALKPNPP
ncbi:hypothetical protein ACFX12_020048 [Malus domestica]